MKCIIVKTWNGQEMDIHNSAYLMECDEQKFKQLAFETMEDMEATKYKVTGISKYSYECEDEDGETIDAGSIRMKLYKGEYAVRIIANINAVYYLSKKEYDETVAGFKDELPEDDFEENESYVYADDGEYFNFIFKL